MGGFNVSFLHQKGVRFLKKVIPSSIRGIIVIPNQSTSTNLSRLTLPKRYSQKDTIFNLSHAAFLTAAFFEEKWDILKEASLDRIHQYYRMQQIPILFEVQKTALANGALMSTLSGSGSTFLSICYAEDSKHLHTVLASKFYKFRVLTLEFDNFGVRFDDEFKL